MSSSKGLGERVYEGSATLGEISATIGLVIAVVISLALIVIASWMLINNKDGNYETIEATITEPNCDYTPKETIDKNNNKQVSPSYTCGMKVSYNYGGKDRTGTINTTSSSKYTQGQKIKIDVNKNNPDDISMPGMSTSMIASIMCCIGITIAGCAGVNYWLTRKSEVYAAAQGAKTVWDIFR